MGQNERTANYGTSVESCSDSSHSAPAVKLRISPSAAYNDRKGILPKNVDNFFEKMGVKKRLAMQTAQKNIYLTYEKSTFRDESIGDDALIRAIRAVHLYHFQSASHGRPFIENSQTDCCRHIEKRWSLYGRLIMRIEYLSDKL